jgi:hypothetical protein
MARNRTTFRTGESDESPILYNRDGQPYATVWTMRRVRRENLMTLKGGGHCVSKYLDAVTQEYHENEALRSEGGVFRDASH